MKASAKKMLGHVGTSGGRGTKNQKATIKMLPGHVARVRVRCGKSNCRCADGERHVAYYHVWHFGGQRRREYIRFGDVAETKAACAARRRVRAVSRAGRAEWRTILNRLRELFAPLDGSGGTNL
jgi:hypothetical protein